MFLPKKARLTIGRGYLAPPVVIILALIILFVAVTLIINAKLFPKPNASPTPSNQSSPLPSPSPPSAKQVTQSAKKSETADWETYENQTLKISIKAPTGWKVETSDSENLIIVNDFSNEIKLTNVDLAVGGPFYGTEKLNVGDNSYDFVFFTQDQNILLGSHTPIGITIRIDKTDKDYNKRLSEINQILSTFQFID